MCWFLANSTKKIQCTSKATYFVKPSLNTRLPSTQKRVKLLSF